MLHWIMLSAWAVVLTAAEPTPPTLTPSFQRVDLAPTASGEVPLALHAQPGTIVSAVLVNCACIHVTTPLPGLVTADGSLVITLSVTGLRPGVEDIQVATSAGLARAQLQIVGPGAGRGAEVLASALTEAARQRWSLIGVAHDLRGEIRHCACAHGSLGAADRLAALPKWVQAEAPALDVAWILSGDADGPRPGVGAALTEAGWRLRDPRIAVAADPGPLLVAPGVIAVIPTAASAVQHRRLLRPVLAGGLAVELLLVDASGQIQARHTMPVDDSLAADPAFTGRFPDRLSSVITEAAAPSTACLACHAAAHAQWSAGPHAAAWTKLPEADRTDACVTCHTTPLTGKNLAPAVHCQACHQGADAHAAQPATVRTTGTSDCRSCHDAQHDPGFQREAAWLRISHSK